MIDIVAVRVFAASVRDSAGNNKPNQILKRVAKRTITRKPWDDDLNGMYIRQSRSRSVDVKYQAVHHTLTLGFHQKYRRL